MLKNKHIMLRQLIILKHTKQGKYLLNNKFKSTIIIMSFANKNSENLQK